MIREEGKLLFFLEQKVILLVLLELFLLLSDQLVSQLDVRCLLLVGSGHNSKQNADLLGKIKTLLLEIVLGCRVKKVRKNKLMAVCFYS